MKKVAFILSVTLFTFGTMSLFQSCKNECKDVVCQNGGTCNEDDGSCACVDGYEGTNCETETRAAFIGSFTASGPINCDVTGSGTFSGTIIVGESATDVKKITMDFGGGILLTGVVDGTSMTIDAKTVQGFDYTGSGSINSNTLTIALTEYDDSVPEDCIYTITGTKQ